MSVRRILRDVWNPIGTRDLPDDEYERYEPMVELYSLADCPEPLADFLLGIERLNYWYGYGSEARARNVANLLIAEVDTEKAETVADQFDALKNALWSNEDSIAAREKGD